MTENEDLGYFLLASVLQYANIMLVNLGVILCQTNEHMHIISMTMNCCSVAMLKYHSQKQFTKES